MKIRRFKFNCLGPALAGFFAFGTLFAGCTGEKAQVGSQTILQVNDHTLTAQEFSNQLATKLKQFDALSAKDPGTLNRTKEDVLRSYTLQALIIDFAKANSLTISDQDLDQEVNSFRSNYPDDISFRRVLADENLSLTAWREQLRQTLLERRVFKKIAEKVQKPTEAEVKADFDANKEKYRRKERVYLRQILAADLTKITEIHESLKKKPNFNDLATKFSEAPEGKNGGLVGWIEKGTVEIFDKAFALPVGGTSDVLQSPYGYHIFKVERKAPAGFATLEEVKPLIEQSLLAQREQAEFASWLDRQIRSSRVQRNQDLIHAISVETRKGKDE